MMMMVKARHRGARVLGASVLLLAAGSVAVFATLNGARAAPPPLGNTFPSAEAAVRAVIGSHNLPLPQKVWDDLVRDPRRPLIATLFFDLYHLTDPVVATAAPALANSFFTMFGTSG